MRRKISDSVNILILVAFFINNIEAKRDYKIELRKCEHYVLNPKMIHYANCTVYKASNNSDITYLYAGLNLAQNVSEFRIRVTFDMLRKDNTKINLLNTELNGCKFLQGEYELNLLRIILGAIRRFGSFPTKCPIASGITYEIRDLYLNPEDFPAFIPALTFMTVVKLYMNNAHEGDIILHGRVRKI